MSSNRSGPKIILCVLALLMVVPNLALAAVAMDQSASVDTSSRASSRAPEACPSSAAGWSVTGTHIYTGTCSISGGAINIQAGADITFEKVTLTHTGTYYFYNYAILRIQNSTILGGTTWYGILGTTGMTLLKIENSTVKGYNQYGVRVYQGRGEIGNSTFDPAPFASSAYGIYFYQATSGYCTKNKVKNASNYALYMYVSSTVWVNNNTVTESVGSYGAYLNSYGGVFENNTIKGGTTNVLRIYLTAPKSFMYNRAYGGAVGLYLYPAVTLNAYYCNFTGNTANDISLATNAKLKAYDTMFNTAAIPSGTSVEVYWRANFSVKWLSNGQSVQGAKLNITDVKNNKDPRNLLTDGTGQVRQIYVMEYLKDSTGKKDCFPYWFNASFTSGGRTFSNYTKGNMTNKTNNFPILLDDIPPSLTLAQPTDGFYSNQTWIIVKAWTERNISKEWPIKAKVQVDSKVYNPIVGADGYIEQNVTLVSDGKHTMSIKATDSDLNMKLITINVTRDTVLPLLTVTSPTDGALTNITTIDVKGTTEPTAKLTVNGATVPVQATGAFTHQCHLVEGDNVFTVKSEDLAHNWVITVLKVKLDTKPPVLAIIQPKNGYKTNQPTLTIQGTTEAKATLTINDKTVPLFGTSFQMSYNLQEGDNLFQIKSCDAAGNCNLTSLHVTLKTTLPSLTVTSPKDGYLTNQEKLSVQGMTDEGARVTVNEHPVSFIGTSFSYELTLREGKNIIKVDAFDEMGNKAEVVIMVYLDTLPPVLAIDNPKDGSTVNTAEVTLDGSTEQNALVCVNGKTVHNTNGAFTTKVALTEGLNNIDVTSMDVAGNKATASVKVILDTKVSLKVNGLTTATALETTNTTYEITGTVDPDATVYVNDYPVNIDKNGNFKTVVQLNIGKNDITVQAEDNLGNKVTNSYRVQRKEVQPPVKPPIIPTTTDGSFSGMLVPILIIVALVAAVGVGGGLYMRKRSKAKEAQKSQVQTPPAATAPTTQAPPMAPQAQQTWPESQPQVAQAPQAWSQPQPQVAQTPQSWYQPQVAQAPQPYGMNGQYPPPPPSNMVVRPMPTAPPPQPVVAHATAVPAQNGVSPQAMALFEEAQRTIENGEAQGQDMSRSKTHLRVAQTFMNKGNSEKVILYSNKAMGRD